MAAAGELMVENLKPEEKAVLFNACHHCLGGDDPASIPESVQAAGQAMLAETLALIDHGTQPTQHPWIGQLSEPWRDALFAALLAFEADRHQAIDLLPEAGWHRLEALMAELNIDPSVPVAMGWRSADPEEGSPGPAP